MQGGHIVPVGKAIHGLRRQLIENLLQYVVFALIARAVKFEVPKQQ